MALVKPLTPNFLWLTVEISKELTVRCTRSSKILDK